MAVLPPIITDRFHAADKASHSSAYPTSDRLLRADDGQVVERGESTYAVERLLEDSWDGASNAFDQRERLAGATVSSAFLMVAVAIAVLSPPSEAYASIPMLAALGLSFAIASRVEFPIGAGYAVPTQLFLVPLFVLAPTELVPLIVMAALGAATCVDALLGRANADRLLDVGTDSWHSVAPTMILLLAGNPSPSMVPPAVIAAALSAQMFSEVVVTSVRLWLGRGIPPRLQLRVLIPIWAIDLMLTPVAAFLAIASTFPGLAAAPLTVLAILLLLALLTHDRTQRIDQAHERLEALRAERSRLEVAVQRIGDAFASKLDLDALLNITMRAAVEALDADAARGSANPGPGRKLVRRATMREEPDFEPALAAAEQTAAKTGKPAVATVNDVYAVACPVIEPGSDLGAGVIALARRAGEFAQSKQDLLLYLCEQAGVAAADIERHTVLSRQALTDELTGLANHRRLQEVLALGTDAHKINGTPLALILFDLDNFKKVNDTRGHQTGDHVLRSVADVLRSCCRAGDEAARYGGEELAIIVHGTELQGVLAIAERARRAVEDLELVDTEGRAFSVTTSIGVAELGTDIDSPQGLIASADCSLYAAKHAGKNRVVHGADLAPGR